MTSEITAFLESAGWGKAARRPLAGDASNRRYERLQNGNGESAVLMIAPPEKGEDTRPFVAMANYLLDLGLSAPRILYADTETGLLLIEDLGDGLFARIAEQAPEKEAEIYAAAIDALAELHRHPPPEFLGTYDRATLVGLAELAREWYAREERESAFSAELDTVFQTIPDYDAVVALRDFHAENLIWLPEREGIARVGLLDFQDALACHPAYDVVSLTGDARRDVSPGLGAELVSHYLTATGRDKEEFTLALSAYGAQRNLRILGVFARLARRDGKPGYLRLLPRVWGHLMADLSHPALARLRAAVLRDLPEPDTAHLDALAR